MNDEDFSPLAESDIEALATAKVFARGRALFDDGALEEPARQGDKISAVCQGSEDEAYALSARLSTTGVDETRCTCPYDHDGICKHLVALLLAWAHVPETFETVEARSKAQSESALFRELASRERDDLARLITQLVETEPKLRAVVKRLLQPRLSEGEVEKTRRAVAAIFKKVLRGGYDANFSGIARDLKFHLRAAASLEATRPADAARLYIAILDGMMSGGNEPFQWDDAGHLTGAATDCVAALARLPASTRDGARRELWETLARAFVFDVDLGGFGFAAGSGDLLQTASDDEWKIVEPILDAALRPASHEKVTHVVFSSRGDAEKINQRVEDYTSSFRRGSILGLKAGRLKKRGDLAGARRVLLEDGTPQQQVHAHLENRDFDAATALAQKRYPRDSGLLREFADQLNEAGEWQRARDWAQQYRLLGWLAHATAQRGEPDAFDLNRTFFKSAPRLDGWRATLELAPQNERENVRAQLWNWLEKQKLHALLFDIALADAQVATALGLWGKLNNNEKNPRHDALAAAAEKAHPDEAFLLWDELARSLIAHRSRDAYRLAAKALKKAQSVLKKHGRADEWAPFIAALRAEYPTLRALKEELDRAKL